MMIDVERQLEEYGAFHDQEWGPIDSEDMLAGLVLTASSSETRFARWVKSNRIGFGVAAAAATFVLVGLIPLLTNLVDREPADPLGTPTVTEPSVPDPIGPQIGVWGRVPHDDSVFGQAEILSVTTGGPGLVAVGRAGDPIQDGGRIDIDAAVWTSVDGIDWSRVPHDESVFGEAGMFSVTAGGPGLVAVGGTRSASRIRDDFVGWLNAAVWTSVDGITWTRVPHDESVFGSASMSSVISAGPGLVAVGSGGVGGMVWTSVDGISWTRTPTDEEVFIDASIGSVTVGGPGVVAVGGGYEAPVWTSDDGISWTRVPHVEGNVFASMDSTAMEDVTSGGPGLVAVGGNSVWTSVDGISWSRDRLFGEDGMSSVTAGRPGLVAVGGDGAIWTSVDGVTWTKVPGEQTTLTENMNLVDVIPLGDDLITVGRYAEGDDDDAAVAVFVNG